MAHSALHTWQIFLELSLSLSGASSRKPVSAATRIWRKKVIATWRCQKYKVPIFEADLLHAKQAAGIKSQRASEVTNYDICVKKYLFRSWDPPPRSL